MKLSSKRSIQKTTRSLDNTHTNLIKKKLKKKKK